MSLSVFLLYYSDIQNTIWKEKYYETFVRELALEIDFEDKTEIEQYNSVLLNYQKKLGLNVDGVDNLQVKRIILESKLYPDFMYKIGYFRSTYSNHGLNSTLKLNGLPDLLEIFNNKKNFSELQKPDWEASLKLVDETIEKFKKRPNFTAEAIYPLKSNEKKPTCEKEALDQFLNEYDKSEKIRRFNYLNEIGQFYFQENLEICGLIPGIISFGNEKKPCTYVISKTDNTIHIKTLEVVKETISYVLEQPNINNYYLRWYR